MSSEVTDDKATAPTGATADAVVSKPDGATAMTSEPNVLETTTPQDGTLPVNQATVAKLAQTSQPAAGTTVTVPEAPIVVSEAEVAPSNPHDTAALAEQIEVLSGEIQALESKIERLTVSGTKTPESTVSLSPSPAASVSTANGLSAVPVKADKTKPTGSVNDIYAKVVERQKETAEQSKSTALEMGEAEDMGSASGIGTIGEILAVFGIILFLLLLASPFVKEMIGESFYRAISSIGWPSAGVSLLLGLILLFFAKGQGALKTIVGLIFLLSAVMYLGASGNSSYLGPLQTYLESVFTFYQ